VLKDGDVLAIWPPIAGGLTAAAADRLGAPAAHDGKLPV
jgi:hypothetical protein